MLSSWVKPRSTSTIRSRSPARYGSALIGTEGSAPQKPIAGQYCADITPMSNVAPLAVAVQAGGVYAAARVNTGRKYVTEPLIIQRGNSGSLTCASQTPRRDGKRSDGWL